VASGTTNIVSIKKKKRVAADVVDNEAVKKKKSGKEKRKHKHK